MPPKKSTGAKAAPKKVTPKKLMASQLPTPLPTRKSRRQQRLAAPEVDDTPSKKRGRAQISGDEDDSSDEPHPPKKKPLAKPAQAKTKTPTQGKAPTKAPAKVKATTKSKRRLVYSDEDEEEEEDEEDIEEDIEDVGPKGERQKLKKDEDARPKLKIAEASRAKAKAKTLVVISDDDEEVAGSVGGKASKGKKGSPRGGVTVQAKVKTKKASSVVIDISSDEDEVGGKPSWQGPKGKEKSVTFAGGDKGSPKGQAVDKRKGKAVDKGGRKRAAGSVEEEPVAKRPKKADSLSEWEWWVVGAEGLQIDESPERFIHDRGLFRQMAWADELFNDLFEDTTPNARRQALSNFEAVRALALSLEEEGVLTSAQKNTLVRHWLENQARLPGTARKALIKWEGLDEEKMNYSDEALVEFSKTKYPAALLALRKRNEMTVHEMDMVIALWAAINEEWVQDGPTRRLLLGANKESIRHFNNLLRDLRGNETKAEPRGEPAPDISLGHYTYLGSIRTPMHALPPGMRKALPSPGKKCGVKK